MGFAPVTLVLLDELDWQCDRSPIVPESVCRIYKDCPDDGTYLWEHCQRLAFTPYSVILATDMSQGLDYDDVWGYHEIDEADRI